MTNNYKLVGCIDKTVDFEIPINNLKSNEQRYRGALTSKFSEWLKTHTIQNFHEFLIKVDEQPLPQNAEKIEQPVLNAYKGRYPLRKTPMRDHYYEEKPQRARLK